MLFATRTSKFTVELQTKLSYTVKSHELCKIFVFFSSEYGKNRSENKHQGQNLYFKDGKCVYLQKEIKNSLI
jgi:hypothetical protein